MTSTDEKAPQYFDLNIKGFGYGKNLRLIPPEGGRKHDPYYRIDIAARQGEKSSATNAYLDAKVCGEKALKLLLPYEADINNDKTKVLIGFRTDGIDAEPFELKGKRAGETGYNIKTRLIFIRFIRIKREGEKTYTLVYKAEKPSPSVDGSTDEASENKDGA